MIAVAASSQEKADAVLCTVVCMRPSWMASFLTELGNRVQHLIFPATAFCAAAAAASTHDTVAVVGEKSHQSTCFMHWYLRSTEFDIVRAHQTN